MPIYEYRCDNGHTFEVLQRMADDRISVCQTCEAPVQQVFHPIAVHFKGSGFYNTDYGTRNRSKETEEAAKDGDGKSDDKSSDKKQSGEKAGATSSTGEKSGGSQGTNGKTGSSESKSPR
jgi:putative FmdB family regulatory protein